MDTGFSQQSGRNSDELNRSADDQRSFQSDGTDSLNMEPVRAGSGADYGVGIDPTAALGDEPALRGMNLDRRTILSYSDIYRHHRETDSVFQRWLIILLASIVAGPAAIGGALLTSASQFNDLTGGMYVFVFGPLIEEMLKVAGILILVEKYPWIIPRWWVIPVGIALSGLTFACIENLWYVFFVIPDASEAIVTWRWTVCTALHGTCSLIAGIGVAKVWIRTDRTGQMPRLSLASPWLVTAIVVHGAYNTSMFFLEVSGYLF